MLLFLRCWKDGPGHEDASGPLALCAHGGPWYQVLCSKDAGEQGKGVIMSKACFSLCDIWLVFFLLSASKQHIL